MNLVPISLTLDEVKILLGEKDLIIHQITKQFELVSNELEQLKAKDELVEKPNGDKN